MYRTIFILAILMPIMLSAQTQNWVYRYSGPVSGSDAYALDYGLDGNIYTAGTTKGSSTSGLDFTVLSLNQSGTQRWVYRYNGPASNEDQAYDIVCGPDSNIYAAGFSTRSSTIYRNFTVASLKSNGTQRWLYRDSGPAFHRSTANKLTYGLDNNIYAAGLYSDSGTTFDFTVISLTDSGTERWIYRYRDSTNNSFSAGPIVYGNDGNIYAAGRVYNSSTLYDIIVISISDSGTQRWVYRYPQPESPYDEANSIVYGLDGNIYIAGSDSNYFTVISLTSSGAQRWTYHYNTGSGYATSISFDTDGNLYAAGRVYNATQDILVTSLNPAGAQRWVYTYNGPSNQQDGASSITYGADSNLYFTGYSRVNETVKNNIIVTSLTDSGVQRWIYLYNGPGNDNDYGSDIVYGRDGKIYTAGSSATNPNIVEITVVSLNNPISMINEEKIAYNPTHQITEVYPNPAKTYFNVRLPQMLNQVQHDNMSIKIFDVSGKVVKEILNHTSMHLDNRQNDNTVRVSLDGIKSGVYFLKINNQHISEKLIVNK